MKLSKSPKIIKIERIIEINSHGKTISNGGKATPDAPVKPNRNKELNITPNVSPIPIENMTSHIVSIKNTLRF